MTVGNIAAITQSNVKRLLAYSSISHAGYILIGFIAGNETGMTAIPLYLLIYTFTNIGAWAVIVALRRKDVIGEHIDEMSGLFFKTPGRGHSDADLPAVARRAFRRRPASSRSTSCLPPPSKPGTTCWP